MTSVPAPVDHLARIIERKRREVARRVRRASQYVDWAAGAPLPRSDAVAALRRGATRPSVIAEIKLRSPSAGQIRPRVQGELSRLAGALEGAGASALSVLCDGPGFGGSPLDLRRAARVVQVPVLFKEFVLDPVQVDLARALGATYVLLLVRVLDDRELARLIEEVRARPRADRRGGRRS